MIKCGVEACNNNKNGVCQKDTTYLSDRGVCMDFEPKNYGRIMAEEIIEEIKKELAE